MKPKHLEAELILVYLEFKTTGRPIIQICRERGINTAFMVWWASCFNPRINPTARLRNHFRILRQQIEYQRKLLRVFAAPSNN